MTSVSARAVAVIVINWNRWRLSFDCLSSLRTSEKAEWHMFLVDNASTDDSRDHLHDLGPDVTVIHSTKNRGWTGGNNLGIEAALQAGYDHFLILNNDAVIERDTLVSLLDTFDADQSEPVLGPVEYSLDGAPDFVGATLNARTGLPVETKAHEVDLATKGRSYNTSYVRGAGLLIHRRHIEAVGLFDDDYFLYYDDTDWCFRAAAKGFTVAMARDARITHIGSASTGLLSPLLTYFMVRNGLLFVERHGSTAQRLRFSIWLLRWLGSLLGSGSRARRLVAILFGSSGTAVAARRGLSDYLSRRFGDCPAMIRSLTASAPH